MNNNTMLKFSGILALVVGGIGAVASISMFQTPDLMKELGQASVIMLLVGSIISIIGGVRFLILKEYDNNRLKTKKTEILVWMILFLLFSSMFVSIPAIITYFNLKFDEKECLNLNDNTNYDPMLENEYQNIMDRFGLDREELDRKIEELEKIKKLREDDVITQDEFEKLKEEILERR